MHNWGWVFVLECIREEASTPLPPDPRLDPTLVRGENAVKDVTGSTDKTGIWMVKYHTKKKKIFFLSSG